MSTKRWLAGIALIAAQPACADVWTLDPGFGNDGIAITDLGTSSDRANAVAVDASGRVWVLAYRCVDSTTQPCGPVIIRYTPSGQLDTSYGGGQGFVALPDNVPGFTNRALAIDGVGQRIIVAGNVQGQPPQSSDANEIILGVAAYRFDGTTDPDFGEGQPATFDFTPTSSSTLYPYDVRTMPDGRITVVGEGCAQGSTCGFQVVRLQPDGSLDETLAGTGHQEIGFGGGRAVATDLILAPDGSMTLGGYVYNGQHSDVALARLTSTGALDPSFDGDGRLTLDLGVAADDSVYFMRPRSGGLAVEATSFNLNASPARLDFVVLSIGDHGEVQDQTVIHMPGCQYYGECHEFLSGGAAVQPDGKLLEAGFYDAGATAQDVFVRRVDGLAAFGGLDDGGGDVANPADAGGGGMGLLFLLTCVAARLIRRPRPAALRPLA